jgi:alanine dehydrogenase
VSALRLRTLELTTVAAPSPDERGRRPAAVQVGAWCLQAQNGGRGVLLSGASGVRPATVVILGAGIAGMNACQVAVGTGAHVSILDVDPAKLRYVHDILGGHVTTVMSNRANVEEEVLAADLVIGAVLIPGARAPRLVPRTLVAGMRPGAAFVPACHGCDVRRLAAHHARPSDRGGARGALRRTCRASFRTSTLP